MATKDLTIASPLSVAVPVLPAALDAQVEGWLEGPNSYAALAEDEAPFVIAQAPISFHPEAAYWLAEFDRICEPPHDQAVIRDWFSRLATVVANPPARDDFAQRVSAAMWALADLPAGVWTAETWREAAKKFKFWPSVAEVGDLLSPHAVKLERKRGILRSMSSAPVPRDTVTAPPQEPYPVQPVPAWCFDRGENSPHFNDRTERDEFGEEAGRFRIRIQRPVRTPAEQIAILLGHAKPEGSA